jgi:ferredoxin--NADP+ reductase
MPHVIVSGCCNDASCVDVCPVDCIHPTSSEAGFANAEMLYIDPDGCIDCGACVEACPVAAIRPDTDTDPSTAFFARQAAEFFADWNDTMRPTIPAAPGATLATPRQLTVAVVGAGAAGGYAARALLHRGVDVRVFDQQMVPGGLVRFGVAPDHAGTKAIDAALPYGSSSGLRMFLGIGVGTEVSHHDLLRFHDAVIYAVGAEVPVEPDMPIASGSTLYSANDFVRWYNGDPRALVGDFDLSGERAAIIGNGNVALDVARVLLSTEEQLAATDISDVAMTSLRNSRVKEVLILGRRGLAESAFTVPEVARLRTWAAAGVSLRADSRDVAADDAARAASGPDSPTSIQRAKVAIGHEFAKFDGELDRRITFRWLVSPSRVHRPEERGDGQVIEVDRNGLTMATSGRVTAYRRAFLESIEADVVFASLGSRTAALDGIPLDEPRGLIPNDGGRVLDTRSGQPIARTYVVGWAKRGSRGGLGVNRSCAEETVDLLLRDTAGTRPEAVSRELESLETFLKDRHVRYLKSSDWYRLDRAERDAGADAGRPRVKITTESDILQTVGAPEFGN